MDRFKNPGAGPTEATARAYGARNGDRPSGGPPVSRPKGAAAHTATAVAAAKRGQRDAIHYLYARHVDDVFSYVLTIVRDRHEAEDITRKVFRELVFEITGYEERSMPFAAWITRVAADATPRPARQDQR